MDTNAEITQLKAEVAALRQAVAALQYFLHIEPPGTPERSGAGLHIRCTSLSLCDPVTPADPQKIQALLSAGVEGPMLTFNGKPFNAAEFERVLQQQIVAAYVHKVSRRAAFAKASSLV